MRIRRNGDAAWKVRAGVRNPTRTVAGYVLLSSPTHPLVGKSGTLGEHRIVLYEMIGAGPHACYWCGAVVRWNAGRGHKEMLVVDHLNEVKSDNQPSNLVPSCNDCNRARGAMLPFLRRLLTTSRDHLISLIQSLSDVDKPLSEGSKNHSDLASSSTMGDNTTAHTSPARYNRTRRL